MGRLRLALHQTHQLPVIGEERVDRELARVVGPEHQWRQCVEREVPTVL